MQLDSQTVIDAVLLFFLALMAGTLGVIVPNNPVLGQPDPQPLVTPEPAKTKEPEFDPTELPRLHEQLRRLSAEIESLQSALTEMRFELVRLDDLIRRADEDQSADKNTPAPEPPPELVSLQRLVKEKQAELERLRIEYEKAKPMFSADQTSAPVVVKSSKDQEWIGLIGNRVMPIDEKHYSKKTRRSGRVVQITFTPKSRGESLEAMVRPGSEFLKLLNGINPTKELLAFYVDKNSFAMFREIRTIARKQGIETAWFPDLRGDGSIVFTNSGGASVGPQK